MPQPFGGDVLASWAGMAEPFMLVLPDGLRWIIEPAAGLDGDGYVRTAEVAIRG